MYLILSLIFNNLSSSGNTIFEKDMDAHQWTYMRENERHYQWQQYIKSLKQKKGAIKSSLIVSGLPTGVVE